MGLIQKFKDEWKNKSGKEKAYMAGGFLSLVLAIIGIFLPIVPQVPFAILAAFLFSKGSKTLHKWVRNNKHLGPPVQDWEDDRVVKPKLKIFSCLAMVVGAALGHYKLPFEWAVALDVVFLICIAFVATRRSERPPNMTGLPKAQASASI